MQRTKEADSDQGQPFFWLPYCSTQEFLSWDRSDLGPEFEASDTPTYLPEGVLGMQGAEEKEQHQRSCMLYLYSLVPSAKTLASATYDGIQSLKLFSAQVPMDSWEYGASTVLHSSLTQCFIAHKEYARVGMIRTRRNLQECRIQPFISQKQLQPRKRKRHLKSIQLISHRIFKPMSSNSVYGLATIQL